MLRELCLRSPDQRRNCDSFYAIAHRHHSSLVFLYLFSRMGVAITYCSDWDFIILRRNRSFIIRYLMQRVRCFWGHGPQNKGFMRTYVAKISTVSNDVIMFTEDKIKKQHNNGSSNLRLLYRKKP